MKALLFAIVFVATSFVSVGNKAPRDLDLVLGHRPLPPTLQSMRPVGAS